MSVGWGKLDVASGGNAVAPDDDARGLSVLTEGTCESEGGLADASDAEADWPFIEPLTIIVFGLRFRAVSNRRALSEIVYSGGNILRVLFLMSLSVYVTVAKSGKGLDENKSGSTN